MGLAKFTRNLHRRMRTFSWTSIAPRVSFRTCSRTAERSVRGALALGTDKGLNIGDRVEQVVTLDVRAAATLT